ncbi:MAG: HAD family hydrolase [Bacteroidota bacterium]
MLPLLLLDLGGVVFQSTGRSSELIDWSIVSQLNHKYGHQLNVGEDLFPTFVKEYNALTKQHLDGPGFLNAIWETLEMNRALVEWLKPRFRLFILSDNYRENIAFISHRFQFADWTEGQYYSFDFALAKNNPEIFRLVLEDLGLKGSSVFYLDDDPGNMERASAFGVKGVRFENNEQAFADLEALLQ